VLRIIQNSSFKNYERRNYFQIKVVVYKNIECDESSKLIIDVLTCARLNVRNKASTKIKIVKYIR